MDMSFANQALSAEYMVKNAKDLKPQVYAVPEHLDKQIAKLKLESMGVSIDKLTPEQEHYLASWDEGTVEGRQAGEIAGVPAPRPHVECGSLPPPLAVRACPDVLLARGNSLRHSQRRHPERSCARLCFPAFFAGAQRSRRTSLGLKMSPWLKSKRGLFDCGPG